MDEPLEPVAEGEARAADGDRLEHARVLELLESQFRIETGGASAKCGNGTHVRKVHANLSRTTEQQPLRVRLKFAGAQPRGFESRCRYRSGFGLMQRM